MRLTTICTEVTNQGGGLTSGPNIATMQTEDGETVLSGVSSDSINFQADARYIVDVNPE